MATLFSLLLLTYEILSVQMGENCIVLFSNSPFQEAHGHYVTLKTSPQGKLFQKGSLRFLFLN